MSSMIHYYPADFQNRVEAGTLVDQNLKMELNKIVKSMHQPQDGVPDTLVARCIGSTCYKHHSLGYKGARTIMFGDIDLRQYKNDEYYVKDVYCRQEFSSENFSKNKSIGPNKIPDSNILNCEHTWPQSRFSKSYNRGTQKADLHHLHPTNSKSNSIRGNNPFAEVNGGKSPTKSCLSSKSGRAIAIPSGIGRSNSFQPPAEHRGNVARALFYFSTRYEMKINTVQEYYLRKWHQDDPVDTEERTRNKKIFTAQGNRNPFVDNPQLVELISNF